MDDTQMRLRTTSRFLALPHLRPEPVKSTIASNTLLDTWEGLLNHDVPKLCKEKALSRLHPMLESSTQCVCPLLPQIICE